MVKKELSIGDKVIFKNREGIVIKRGAPHEFIIQFADGSRRVVMDGATEVLYDDNNVDPFIESDEEVVEDSEDEVMSGE